MKNNPEISAFKDFEQFCWGAQKCLIGIDEVGRGPFFGPMFLGCVNLKNYINNDLKFLNELTDSKKLTEKKRISIFFNLQQNAEYSFVAVDPWLIDKINVNKATEFYVKKMLHDFAIKYQLNLYELNVLADFMKIDAQALSVAKFKYLPKGELYSKSVAAASILAKVLRDNLMQKYEKHFPDYFLAKNMGYGTKSHGDKIKEKGYSFMHRASFCTTFLNNILLKNKLCKN